ncbi:STM3941 family protein [Bradyrhizobium sp. SSUT77]|uniref:STM3941 family protein n=1 Tax=Bradyrhizobium sp. SSUT77 TaxID=3040603 RepID=UPI00244C5FCA|nr:STM3941 family protein [Bradyrhizobium sp. SSUT77]MDH2344765.1 STM3941 family protein [Bradyrhizobium sp. SSUT77]
MAMLGESMHAHHDGLTLAVADSPQSVASAGCVDASNDLEISLCKTQLRLLVAAGFAMTLLSATLVLDWWDGLGDHNTMVGYAGILVFALMTIRLIWMLPAERGPVVIVTPYGIRDLRIGNEFLLWDSIAKISAEERRGRKMIVLTPTPALQRQLCAIRGLARCAQADRQNGRIVIRSAGLATDFETLLRACRDRHAASSPRTALQQEDERGTQGFAVQAS